MLRNLGIYISPATKVTKVQLSQSLLTLSTTETAAVVKQDGTVDLEARDNSWDIWGDGDYDED